MTIDTKNVTSWLKTHLVIAIPIGLAVIALIVTLFICSGCALSGRGNYYGKSGRGVTF